MSNKVRMEVPYFQVPNDIMDQEINVEVYNKDGEREVRKIRATEKLVYIYLCRCGNQGSTAFPSYNTIASKCSISRKKAIEAVTVLENNGFIKKEIRKVGHNNNYSNIYDVINPSELSTPPREHSTPPSELSTPNKELSIKNEGKRTNINNGVFEENSIDDKSYSFPEYRLVRQASNDCIRVIEYYLRKYKEYTGKNHPRLKLEQWDKVVNNISSFSCYDDYMDRDFDLDPLQYEDIIDQHFMTNYKGGTDYNINHFANNGIIVRRYYEAGCH